MNEHYVGFGVGFFVALDRRLFHSFEGPFNTIFVRKRSSFGCLEKLPNRLANTLIEKLGSDRNTELFTNILYAHFDSTIKEQIPGLLQLTNLIRERRARR